MYFHSIRHTYLHINTNCYGTKENFLLLSWKDRDKNSDIGLRFILSNIHTGVHLGSGVRGQPSEDQQNEGLNIKWLWKRVSQEILIE